MLPECVASVEVFLASSTQWRFAGMAAAPIGLDYAGVEAAVRGLGRSWDVELFQDLRVMERAALDELGKRSR